MPTAKRPRNPSRGRGGGRRPRKNPRRVVEEGEGTRSASPEWEDYKDEAYGEDQDPTSSPDGHIDEDVDDGYVPVSAEPVEETVHTPRPLRSQKNVPKEYEKYYNPSAKRPPLKASTADSAWINTDKRLAITPATVVEIQSHAEDVTRNFDQTVTDLTETAFSMDKLRSRLEVRGVQVHDTDPIPDDAGTAKPWRARGLMALDMAISLLPPTMQTALSRFRPQAVTCKDVWNKELTAGMFSVKITKFDLDGSAKWAPLPKLWMKEGLKDNEAHDLTGRISLVKVNAKGENTAHAASLSHRLTKWMEARKRQDSAISVARQACSWATPTAVHELAHLLQSSTPNIWKLQQRNADAKGRWIRLVNDLPGGSSTNVDIRANGIPSVPWPTRSSAPMTADDILRHIANDLEIMSSKALDWNEPENTHSTLHSRAQLSRYLGADLGLDPVSGLIVSGTKTLTGAVNRGRKGSQMFRFERALERMRSAPKWTKSDKERCLTTYQNLVDQAAQRVAIGVALTQALAERAMNVVDLARHMESARQVGDPSGFQAVRNLTDYTQRRFDKAMKHARDELKNRALWFGKR